jgi:DNA-binding NarL/FixJ family response regulator
LFENIFVYLAWLRTLKKIIKNKQFEERNMVEAEVKMLLVEDNQDFREHVGHMLRERFSSILVSEAGSCLDALKIMNSHVHNLIFMDINLPDGMGLDLTKTITDEFSGSVVVVLSVNDMPEYREASFKSGASHFFSKANFSFQEVVEFIEDFLSGKVSRHNLN